jgi:hypothetical protein
MVTPTKNELQMVNRELAEKSMKLELSNKRYKSENKRLKENLKKLEDENKVLKSCIGDYNDVLAKADSVMREHKIQKSSEFDEINKKMDQILSILIK